MKCSGAVLFIAFLSMASKPCLAQAMKSCVNDVLSEFVWRQASWPLLGVARAQAQKNGVVLQPPLDFKYVDSVKTRALVEFSLALCAVSISSGASGGASGGDGYKFRPLSEQFDQSFEDWHNNPQSSAFIFDIASWLASKKQSYRELLSGPIFLSLQKFLLLKTEELGLSERERLQTLGVLSRSFLHIEVSSIDVFDRGPMTYGGHRLDLVFPMRPFDLVLTLFHELSHVGQKPLREGVVPDLDFAQQDWVYYTIEEEFRAQFLTERFRQAWIKIFPQYILDNRESRYSDKRLIDADSNRVNYEFSNLDPERFFRVFRSKLRFSSSQQKFYVERFFKNFDKLSVENQNKILLSWLE